VDAAQMWQIFAEEYLEPGAFELIKFGSVSEEGVERIATTVRAFGREHVLTGTGNGPIAAFCDALSGTDLGLGEGGRAQGAGGRAQGGRGEGGGAGSSVRVLDYSEHALTAGRDAEAAAYLEIEVGDRVLWGVGISESIVDASLRGVISALNRAAR
jgi:2-isopropylmalate synthase